MAILTQMLFAIAAIMALSTIAAGIIPNMNRIIGALKGRQTLMPYGISQTMTASPRRHRGAIRKNGIRRHPHSSQAA